MLKKVTNLQCYSIPNIVEVEGLSTSILEIWNIPTKSAQDHEHVLRNDNALNSTHE